MNRPFTVQPVLNGWIIEIGCQKAVFTDAEFMGKEIARYLADPETVEKEYMGKSKVNNAPEPIRPSSMPSQRAEIRPAYNGESQAETSRY